MRFRLALLLLPVLSLAPIRAQTTGFPGINDLTVNGITPGSTSCGFVLATGLPMTFTVSAAPAVPVAIFIDTCPCRAGFLAFPPQFCYGMVIPQSLDIQVGTGCILVAIGGATNTAGVFTVTFGPCSTPFRFSTQAVVVDPACPPYLLTQAYQVSC